jgi:phosphatidate cytidylyltransferase
LNKLLLRGVVGLIYVTIILISLYSEDIILAGVLLIMNGLAVNEMFLIYRPASVLKTIWILSVSSIFFALNALIIMEMIPAGYLVLNALIPLVIFFSAFTKVDRINLEQTICHIFSLVYITIPLLLAVYLNKISVYQGDVGFVMIIFVIVWTNDTFAYLTGISLGRHKFFERISPKKTWEGLIGGLIASIGVSLLFMKYLFLLKPAEIIILAVVVAVSSVLGDLFESLIKRVVAVKDSGEFLPGHGGILDRIDSLLIAIPMSLLYYLLIH